MLAYCSLKCYRDQSHSNCSEEFYREQVMGELSSTTATKQDRQHMREILMRMHSNQEQLNSLNDEYVIENNQQSDDPELSTPTLEPMSTLADRLQSMKDLDLDNPSTIENIWVTFTPEERELFHQQLLSGMLSSAIDVWEPWWGNVPEVLDSLQLVQDTSMNITEIVLIPQLNATLKELIENNKLKPTVDILAGKMVAKEVAFNAINVILSYVYNMRIYNGDTTTYPLDLAEDITSTSIVLSKPIGVCTSSCEAVTHFRLCSSSPQPIESRRVKPDHQLHPSSGLVDSKSLHSRQVSLACHDAVSVLQHPCKILATLLHVLHIIDTALTAITTNQRIISSCDSTPCSNKNLTSACHARENSFPPRATAAEKSFKLGYKLASEQDFPRWISNLRKPLLCARRKSWFLCCWANDIVQNVCRAQELAPTKRMLDLLIKDIDKSAATTSEPESLDGSLKLLDLLNSPSTTKLGADTSSKTSPLINDRKLEGRTMNCNSMQRSCLIEEL